MLKLLSCLSRNVPCQPPLPILTPRVVIHYQRTVKTPIVNPIDAMRPIGKSEKIHAVQRWLLGEQWELIVGVIIGEFSCEMLLVSCAVVDVMIFVAVVNTVFLALERYPRSESFDQILSEYSRRE